MVAPNSPYIPVTNYKLNAVMPEETIIFINNAVKTKIIFWELLVLLGAVLGVVMQKNMWYMVGMVMLRLGL
jgi:hypothetical protein